AQDGHTVRDPADLLHAMADVDDAHTLALQTAHVLEEHVDLRIRQGRRRLVQYQEPARARERGGDLDELLPPDAEPAHGRGWVDVVEPDGRQRLRGPSIQRGTIHEPESSRQAVEEEVLRHAERAHQIEL